VRATPEQLDAVAASLAKAYQRIGKFCAIVRLVDADGDVKVISPECPVEVTVEFLKHASEVLFNGPATIRYPKA
jgi:hypothetical protein